MNAVMELLMSSAIFPTEVAVSFKKCRIACSPNRPDTQNMSTFPRKVHVTDLYTKKDTSMKPVHVAQPSEFILDNHCITDLKLLSEDNRRTIDSFKLELGKVVHAF